MASLDEWLSDLFAFLGPAAVLVALFFLFVIDAAIFPTLPEIAIVVTYLYALPGWDPSLRAALLLGMGIGGEAVGNSLMYLWVRKLFVDRGRMPRIIERAMTRWTNFLVVSDERIILVNRIAPVVPFVGAFIAVLRWSYLKSLVFIVIGASAKYALLLILVGSLGIIYSRETATLATLGAVLIIIAASFLASYLYRRRIPTPPRKAA